MEIKNPKEVTYYVYKGFEKNKNLGVEGRFYNQRFDVLPGKSLTLIVDTTIGDDLAITKEKAEANFYEAANRAPTYINGGFLAFRVKSGASYTHVIK